MKATKKTRIAFLSTILGDGWIGKSGHAEIKHSIDQLDYLHWKRKFLCSNGVRCGEIKEINNSGYPGCMFYISVSSYGKLYRKILYRKGIKNFYKRKLLNHLEPIHLAIWYMDDGGLSQKKRNGVVHANELFLNTHTTKENNQVLIDYFREVWELQFSQVKNKGLYRLRCGTKEARKFLDIIREYVIQIPSMNHKLNIKSDLAERRRV